MVKECVTVYGLLVDEQDNNEVTVFSTETAITPLFCLYQRFVRCNVLKSAHEVWLAGSVYQ